MGRPALGAQGGTSPAIHLRLPAEDASQLDRLATRHGQTRSKAVREMIYAALEADSDTRPPQGGATA